MAKNRYEQLGEAIVGIFMFVVVCFVLAMVGIPLIWAMKWVVTWWYGLFF